MASKPYMILLIFIITLITLILIHELGHYVAARYCGVKVLRFSLGFGKPLYTWCDQQGTEYVIALIPLGGYVRLEENTQPSLIKRAIVALAGSFANLLFAVLLYGIVLAAGITHIRPIIGYVVPESIGAQAGLQPGMELRSINHQPVSSWNAVGMAMISHMGYAAPLMVQTQQNQQIRESQLQLSQWQLTSFASDWLGSLGLEPALPAEILTVQQLNPYQRAAYAGMQVGDRIIAIQNQPVTDRMMFLRVLKLHAGQEVRLTFEREERRLHAMVRVGQCRSWRGAFEGYLGITFTPIQWSPSALYTEQAAGLQVVYQALQKTWQMMVFNGIVVGKLLRGELSIQNLSGPLGMLAGVMMVAQQGFIHYLNFLALLSIGLGMVNLLPIPGLDGARLIYLLIERLRGRPLSAAVEALVFRLGVIFLIVLMVQIFIGDILRFVCYT